MALTREQIESIAHLARLALTESETPVYQKSLSSIFDLVGELNPPEWSIGATVPSFLVSFVIALAVAVVTRRSTASAATT